MSFAYKRHFDAVTKYSESRSELAALYVNCKNIEGNNMNFVIKNIFFPKIGKKNDQTTVSDADRDITSLGSSENVGKTCFREYPFTLGFGFLSQHWKPMTDLFVST